MSLPILKPLQPLAVLPYADPQIRFPEFKKPLTYLQSRPDKYVLVNECEAGISDRQSLISRNIVDGSALLLRGYYQRYQNDPCLLIHDCHLALDGSFDEVIEAWRKELRRGQHYLMLIQSSQHRRLTTDLLSYLIYRGVSSYAEIVVPTAGPFHVAYRPQEDALAILGDATLFVYPGFFSTADRNTQSA